MAKYFILFSLLFSTPPSKAQALIRVQIGGFYQSINNTKISAFEPIVSSQDSLSDMIVYKGGFLFGRLGSIIINNPTLYNYSTPHLLVYPNPAKSVINFYVTPIYEIKSTSIYSSNGNLVYKGGIEKTINVSNFSSGLYYLLVILKDDSRHTARFVKL